MTRFDTDPLILTDIKAKIDLGLASGELLTASQLGQQLRTFQDNFGPAVLRNLDGEALLRRMHGRADLESRCLMYWLEFKNDDEFATNRFGGIGGGAATKFGVFQRSGNGAWISGSSHNLTTISLDEAIEIARRQRDELLAGDEILRGMSPTDTSDDAYAKLESAMTAAAPQLAGDGWSHKYWFLLNPDRLDDFHTAYYQRFHLFKLLQAPPDGLGIWNGHGRFICAGRFVSLARSLDVPTSTLTRTLNRRSPMHRYWRIGTAAGGTRESHWPYMRDGRFVSIGWKAYLSDLTSLIGNERAKAKSDIRDRLLPGYEAKPGVATRQAGEILNFAAEIAENDIVLACEGQTVLGAGRITGPYAYDDRLAFPHTRPVEWLFLDEWQLPEREGLRTTVFELGNKPQNLLALEERLLRPDHHVGKTDPKAAVTKASSSEALPALDPITGRIDAILRRKGQVILYGPPGTGKTHHAIAAARELAARHAFNKSFQTLSSAERAAFQGEDGLVRICTFHPGYGYEDFMEGLRPSTINDQLIFLPRDGHFKRLCAAARRLREKHFFLVIDEINRGDLPRIFGELLTVIELNKRDLSIVLPGSAAPFAVPPNVFLIGTMNTADRSISMLDSALRRRFGFVELMPDSSALLGQKAGNLMLGPWLDALNHRIRKHLKRDARNLQIGHAYLMSRQPITSVAEFTRILRDDIIPLLEEYCYDDYQMLSEILGLDLVDVERGRIHESMFSAGSEESLINALTFEELEQLVPPQDTATGSDDDSEDEAGDAEDRDDASSSA